MYSLLPLKYRNKVTEAGLDTEVSKFEESENEAVRSLAKSLQEEWNKLEIQYTIPKKKRSLEESKDDADADKTKTAEGDATPNNSQDGLDGEDSSSAKRRRTESGWTSKTDSPTSAGGWVIGSASRSDGGWSSRGRGRGDRGRGRGGMHKGDRGGTSHRGRPGFGTQGSGFGSPFHGHNGVPFQHHHHGGMGMHYHGFHQGQANGSRRMHGRAESWGGYGSGAEGWNGSWGSGSEGHGRTNGMARSGSVQETPVKKKEERPLPPNWHRAVSDREESKGQTYYYNTVTGECTWSFPKATDPSTSTDKSTTETKDKDKKSSASTAATSKSRKSSERKRHSSKSTRSHPRNDEKYKRWVETTKYLGDLQKKVAPAFESSIKKQVSNLVVHAIIKYKDGLERQQFKDLAREVSRAMTLNLRAQCFMTNGLCAFHRQVTHTVVYKDISARLKRHKDVKSSTVKIPPENQTQIKDFARKKAKKAIYEREKALRAAKGSTSSDAGPQLNGTSTDAAPDSPDQGSTMNEDGQEAADSSTVVDTTMDIFDESGYVSNESDDGQEDDDDDDDDLGTEDNLDESRPESEVEIGVESQPPPPPAPQPVPSPEAELNAPLEASDPPKVEPAPDAVAAA